MVQNSGNGPKHYSAEAIIIALAILTILLLFGAGFIIGRLTCPKLKPFKETLTPKEPIVRGGSGILVPLPGTGAGLQPEEGIPSLPGGISPIWFSFSDQQLDIQVRAIAADSVNYQFKKRWFTFQSATLYGGQPIIQQLSVYGVAPESVQVQGEVPEPAQKNFSLIVSCTTLPSANLLLGYKNFLFHLQYIQVTKSPDLLVIHSICFGLGYYWRF